MSATLRMTMMLRQNTFQRDTHYMCLLRAEQMSPPNIQHMQRYR